MAPSDTTATFETFQAELARLVAQFDRQHPTYTAPDYNEQTLRADFLDAFFRALGWDVGNQKGLIHTEREVDIEVRTHLSGRQTRADYVFRLNRTERFTCEAKKPAEVLHDRHIFQAKRDAFARGVPLALLSDFEETKIYIVGARPHVDDPHTGEWKVLHFRQYNDAARELWDLLACDSVKAGSIDRLIDSLPKRPLRLKGRQGYLIKPDRTRSLDADFLNFLDDVRQQLGSDLPSTTTGPTSSKATASTRPPSASSTALSSSASARIAASTPARCSRRSSMAGFASRPTHPNSASRASRPICVSVVRSRRSRRPPLTGPRPAPRARSTAS